MIDERTEQLINRRLDHELSEEEALELNKRLIRSPEARALLEEYERTDGLARETLRTWSLQAGVSGAERAAAEISTPHSRLSRIGVGVRAAAAALLLVTMAGAPSFWKAAPPQPRGRQTDAVANLLLPAPAPPASPVVEGPRHETHQLHRDVIGVWDEETQSIYLLEMDQLAERVVPLSQSF